MTARTRITLYVLVLAAGAAWTFLSAGSALNGTGRPPAPQAGFAAPDFTLQTPGGVTMTLSDLRGQAVIVNFWATWCPPCKAEMPALQKMYTEYAPQGLVILGVDMTYQDDPARVAPFIDQYGLTFPILLEGTGSAASAYQVQSLPTSFFIDRKGIIQQVVIGGPMAEALLRTRIEEILK